MKMETTSVVMAAKEMATKKAVKIKVNMEEANVGRRTMSIAVVAIATISAKITMAITSAVMAMATITAMHPR